MAAYLTFRPATALGHNSNSFVKSRSHSMAPAARHPSLATAARPHSVAPVTRTHTAAPVVRPPSMVNDTGYRSKYKSINY